MKKIAEEKFSFIIAVIMSIICMLGYSLNSCIFGFVYLSFAIMIIISQMVIFKEISENKYKKWIKVLMIFLTNFGIFFSYWFFAPAVFLADLIYYIKINKKKVLSKNTIIFVVISILIPSICGAQFIFMPNKAKEEYQASKNMVENVSINNQEEKYIGEVNLTKIQNSAKNEGYIYRNLISNFIPFIPFIVFAIYFDIKNKNLSYSTILLVTLFIFILSTYIFVKIGILSTYAFFKSHYLLWPISICILYKSYIILIKSRKSNTKNNILWFWNIIHHIDNNNFKCIRCYNR